MLVSNLHWQVRELQRRQQEDTAREERRLKAIADKEAAERDKRAQLKMQEEAFALKLQAGFPQFWMPSLAGEGSDMSGVQCSRGSATD